MLPLQSHKGALAVAAVIDIAVNSKSRPVSAKALAARHGLAPRRLEPMLQALVRAGVLRGVRGPGGGYEIARDQRDITAEEIIRIADTEEEEQARIPSTSPLVLNVIIPVFLQAEHASAEVLMRVSVEDLVRAASTLV